MHQHVRCLTKLNIPFRTLQAYLVGILAPEFFLADLLGNFFFFHETGPVL